jgi:hypothetical protein
MLDIKIPKTINKQLGYDPQQVAELLAEANDWEELTSVTLSIVENGLDIDTTDRVIDAAIDHLQLTAGLQISDDELDKAKEHLAELLALKPGGRFPLAGVFEKGFDVKTVDSLLMMAELELFGGDQLDTKLLRPGFIPMVRMGYLSSEASESLELIAKALISNRN